MLLSDITFLIIIPLLALIFLVLGMIYKGVIWFSIISAVGWFLFGFFCIVRDQAGVELFMWQRELGIFLVMVGIAVFLMPWWVKEKKADVIDSLNEDSITFEESASEHRKRMQAHRDKIRGMQGKNKDEFVR